MSQTPSTIKLPAGPVRVLREELKANDAAFITFNFLRGSNVYAFSHEVEGKTRYTLVDAGDPRYEDTIHSVLASGGVDPASIERIIITHRHVDHSGLIPALSKHTKPKITVHANFRGFVEEPFNKQEQARWPGFDPARLKDCNMEYLAPHHDHGSVNIGGVDFVNLCEPMAIGSKGSLQILACPHSVPAHTPDQVLVLYSPKSNGYDSQSAHNGFLPTDYMLFTGDLWLMLGPQTDRRMRDLSLRMKRHLTQVKQVLTGKGLLKMNVTDQDAKAKEALKKGFSLIRVQPAHGVEFIGSRIIANGLLANRDVLFKLGYPITTDQSMLKSAELAPKVKTMMEKAYACFVEELQHWRELGYSIGEVSELLARIYREQKGGSKLSAEDRKQRRVRIRETMAKLRDDSAAPDDLRGMAAAIRFSD